jgi:hypothetical protein
MCPARLRSIATCWVDRPDGKPTFLRVGNIWIITNVGGGPTDDKPEVLAAPPRDPNVLSYFLNLRAADIKRCYDLWSSRGAPFITEPKVHATEMRCCGRSGRMSDRSWANFGDARAPRLVRVRRAGLGERDTRDVLTSWLQTKPAGIESPST